MYLKSIYIVSRIIMVSLTSSQVLTESKSFERAVRSSLPATVDPMVVRVDNLELFFRSSVVERVGMVLTSEAKETTLGLEIDGGPP